MPMIVLGLAGVVALALVRGAMLDSDLDPLDELLEEIEIDEVDPPAAAHEGEGAPEEDENPDQDAPIDFDEESSTPEADPTPEESPDPASEVAEGDLEDEESPPLRPSPPPK